MTDNSKLSKSPCCSISRPLSVDKVPSKAPLSASPGSTEGMVYLDGGSFLMGTDEVTFLADGEGPVREVTLSPFWIEPYAVTNQQFAQFVEQSGYTTEAEGFGWSYVFYQFLPDDFPPTRAVAAAPWWRQVFSADWAHPEGPGSSLEGRMNHPVVHVSWHDAFAYAAWMGKHLPSEAQWEYAARGGLEQNSYPWGNRLVPNKKHRCNIWQGSFPDKNTLKDGYGGTAPVDAFDPNGYGLFNMTGNTWEWCHDWFSAEHTNDRPLRDPVGPATGSGKVTKGGSYLCHLSYCNRYRVAARTQNTPDSSTGHTGLRLVREAP